MLAFYSSSPFSFSVTCSQAAEIKASRYHCAALPCAELEGALKTQLCEFTHQYIAKGATDWLQCILWASLVSLLIPRREDKLW